MIANKSNEESNITYVPIKKIKPLYFPNITEVYNKRMRKRYNSLEIYDLLLPVEKHPIKDEYLLVGAYDTYSFIKTNTDLSFVPCIVEGFTNKRIQYLKILSRLQNNGDTNKANKQSIFNTLRVNGLNLTTILNYTGFGKQDFKDYNYNNTIPTTFINNNTTEKTLNWIDELKLHSSVKNFLFERAGLPKGNNNRLTEEKRKFLEHFFKSAKRFNQLPPQEQIKVLISAINFKGEIMPLLQSKIDSFLE